MPNQCWQWGVDPVLFTWPVTVRWYSLCFMAVFASGWYLLRWQMVRGGHKRELAVDFVLWAVVAVLLGGWPGHQVFYRFDTLVNNPGEVFKFKGGIRGLSSHGSTIGLVTALILFALRHKIPIFEMIDRFSFSAACGAIGVRVGNFFNSEVLGRPTDLPWAVCFVRRDNIPRHPSQLYEVALGLCVLGLLFVVDRWAGREKRPLKLVFGTFFASYFSLRFFVEFFKAHQAEGIKEQALANASAITMGQYLSLPFVIFGAVMIWQALKSRNQAPRTAALKAAKKKRGKKKR